MGMMWHYGEPEDGTLWVRIDRADRPVNALSRAALIELAQLVDRIRVSPDITGVVFKSGKPGNFIAGADVTELKELQGIDAARDISRFGQQVFEQLEDLSVPTVALISGACLGGGLEFALACRYRIADDHPKTLLALPEVKLGLIPGWGGTVRLPRLIGLFDALPMILTGKMLSGKQARSKGLVHDVVPIEALDGVAEQILRAHREHGTASALFRPVKRPLWMRLMNTVQPLQRLALRQAEKQVLAETRGHYPAPEKALEVLRGNLGAGRSLAYETEARAVASLADHPVTTECMRLFFLQEEAKKPPASVSTPREPNFIHQAAVIGAGAMGAGIALLLARKHIWTRLKDLNPEMVAAGLQTIRQQVRKDVARRRLTPLEASRALDHLSPTTDYRGLKRADVVIEAIIEDLSIKRRVFRELAEASGPETVLATNTSSLLVADIARDVPHPERVVGLHFFNPPHRMPLVEVVRTAETSPEALATAWALVQRLGKTGVVVGDCAGFLVNRLLAPYMNEAGYLLAEVSDPLELERAAVEFGMPMGPLELTDLVGIAVAAHVSQNMHAAYGARMQPAPLWLLLDEQRRAGTARTVQLIRKRRGEKRVDPRFQAALADIRRRQPRTAGGSPSRRTIIQRLIYPVINEALRCLDEGVAARAEDVDLAMVFGTGFAPFRGGPLRYAESVGWTAILDTLEQFAAEHPRLEPCEPLRRLAAERVSVFDFFGSRQELTAA